MRRPEWVAGSKAERWWPRTVLGTLRSRSRARRFCAFRRERAGESYVGRVLVLDVAKGGVATAWMLNEMKARGVVPAALILNAVNPIMVQGAALADFTMVSGFDLDITQAIPNGTTVEVESDRNAAVHTRRGMRESFRNPAMPCTIGPAAVQSRLPQCVFQCAFASAPGCLRCTFISTWMTHPNGMK